MLHLQVVVCGQVTRQIPEVELDCCIESSTLFLQFDPLKFRIGLNQVSRCVVALTQHQLLFTCLAAELAKTLD